MLDLQKIYELSLGIDEHIKKLTSFTELLRDIKLSLDELRHSQENAYMQELLRIREDYSEINTQLKLRGLPETSRYEREFDSLRKEVASNEWPAAVDPDLICNDDSSATNRAEAILDIFVSEHLRGKKFLDFGCGEGHVVMEAAKREAVSIGYDVIDQWKFGSRPGITFSTDLAKIQGLGPFDIILMHDVIDHSTTEPIQLLTQVRKLLKNEGKLYLKCHPWCSRHGSHIYKQLNKAFIHLVLDDIELTRFGGIASEHCIKLSKPVETYKHWIEAAGFDIQSELIQTSDVEPYFLKTSLVNNKIRSHWKADDVIENHMSVDFVEYVLKNSGSKEQIF